jgi:uncharacterized protein DUF2760
MHRIATAFRAFFRVLFNRMVADQIDQVLKAKPVGAIEHQPDLETKVSPASPAVSKPAAKPAKAPAKRNDALNLLAALQREARLVDFIQEPIAALSDAQIGAAVRDVHRNCQVVVGRMFALEPVEQSEEGSQIEIREGYDPARIRLLGNVTGQPPFRGTLCHHGWKATRCELPRWNGGEESLLVVAPAELEIK